MKKIVVLLLVLMITISVCSCSVPPSESAQVQLEDVLSTLADGLAEMQKQENIDETDVSVNTPANVSSAPMTEFEEERTAVCGITLKELKSINPQKELLFSKGDLLNAYGDFICTMDDAENFTICDSWGNELEDGLIVSAYEPYEGYLITLREGTLVDQTQLITSDGEIIIPYIEADIDFLNDRYLQITVPVEVTNNAAEAILRETDNLFSLGVQEGDILYKGYIKVFDLQTGEYVPGLELRTNDSDVAACGDTLYVRDDHEYNMILDANGNILAEGFQHCKIAGMLYIISYGYKSEAVYDSNLNKLFDSGDYYLNGIDGAKYYLNCAGDDYMDGVMDVSGSILIDAKYNFIKEYHDGLFVVNAETANGEQLYGLCDSNGNEILACEYDYLEYEQGYYRCKKGDAYTLFAYDGKKIADLGEYAEGVFSYREEKGKFYVLVLNTGEYSMEFERKPQTLHYEEQKLFVAYDKLTDKYALFECVNGTQLTEYEYDEFKYHAGKVYARSGESYTIYEIQYQYR